MYTVKEIRSFSPHRVYQLCCKYKFATKMTNEEYDNFLSHFDDQDKNWTPEEIIIEAKYLSDHSEDHELSEIYFLMVNEAMVIFTEIEGGN